MMGYAQEVSPGLPGGWTEEDFEPVLETLRGLKACYRKAAARRHAMLRFTL